MNDDVVLGFEFKMGDIEVADGIECRRNGAVALGARTRRAEFPLDLTQGAQHAGAVEALPFTMFAEAHLRIIREATATITPRHHATACRTNIRAAHQAAACVRLR